MLTTPACERIYRSLGNDAVVETRLAADAGARIDWLPQETILFEGARLNRRIEVDLAAGATLLAVEAVLLGREAMGEAARGARLSDNWRIRRDGRLIHAEATAPFRRPARARQHLAAGAAPSPSPPSCYVCADAERRLDAVRALLPSSPAAPASIGERLIVRLLAPTGLALRRLDRPHYRSAAGGGQPAAPLEPVGRHR